MNRSTGFQKKPNSDQMYYFTALIEGKYQTLFVGWLSTEFIEGFEALSDISTFACVNLKMGEHTFITDVGAPLYLLNYENDEIFAFAGDSNELNLYPSGNIPPDLDASAMMNFPSFFTKEVESLIEFKLFNKLWAQCDGIWVPCDPRDFDS